MLERRKENEHKLANVRLQSTEANVARAREKPEFRNFPAGKAFKKKVLVIMVAMYCYASITLATHCALCLRTAPGCPCIGSEGVCNMAYGPVGSSQDVTTDAAQEVG